MCHKNFIEDKMTGRLDIVWRILRKFQKKLEIKSQNPKKDNFLSFQLNLPKTTISGPVFNFFPPFPKLRQSILSYKNFKNWIFQI